MFGLCVVWMECTYFVKNSDLIYGFLRTAASYHCIRVESPLFRVRAAKYQSNCSQ
jgi:hypothetical protein